MPKYIHVPRPTGEKKYIPAPRPTGEPKYIPAPRPKNNSEYIPAPRPKGEPKYVPAPRPAKKGEYIPIVRNPETGCGMPLIAKEATQANIGGGEFTAAERTRLKECLKTALSNVNYAKYSDFDGSYGSPQNRVIVINVPHASEADFKGHFFTLCDEVLLEDPVVFHSFYMRIYQKQHRPTALANVAGLKTPPDVQQLGLIKKGNPDWYLGFSRDSYIEITSEGPQTTQLNVQNHFTFQIGGNNTDLIFENDVYCTTTAHRITFSKFISFSENDDEPPNPNELSLFNLNLLGNTTWHLLAGSKKGISKKTSDGLIIVYDADKWEGKNITKKIPKLSADKTKPVETNMRFYDNSLFNKVFMKVKANKFDFELKKLKIVLNGVKILSDYSYSFNAGDEQTNDLNNEIQNYRKTSLLFNHCENLSNLNVILNAPDYNPTEIVSNPILRHAAGELGKAWGLEYGPWHKLSNGEWDTGPQNWCGRFNCWGIWDAMEAANGIPYNLNKPTNNEPFLFPFPTDSCTPFYDWFKPADLIYLPIYYINGKFIIKTNYTSLGNLVKPGYAVNFKGHGAFFLYWVEHKHMQLGTLNPDIIYLSSRIQNEDPDIERENFEQILEIKPDAPYKPGRFREDFAINWFAHISGCSGGTVRIGVGAVICMSTWNQEYVDYLYLSAKRHGSVVPWANDFDLYNSNSDTRKKNEDNAKNVINGFARTDGSSL